MLCNFNKGDYYSINEIQKIKKKISEHHFSKEIKWFDCQKILKKYPKELNKLENSPLGSCPPFLIINSNDLLMKNEKIYLARKYSWGICNVENENHSDIKLFHHLLYFSFLEPTIEITECIEQGFIHGVLENKKLRLGFFSGVFFAGVITAIGFGFNKVK